MPEGDSLVRLAYRLRPVMEQRELIRSDFRTPQFATVDFSGWTVTAIRPTGKYLSMHVEAPRASSTATPLLVILSHLGMDGSWRIDARPTHRTRCILHFEEHRIVGHDLSALDVLTPQQVEHRFDALGPDLLDPGWHDPETAQALLDTAVANMQSAPDQPIAAALINQRLVAGIGNIYRCEVLFLAGISPYRMISTLDTGQLIGLVTLSRDLMTLNIPPHASPRDRRSTIDVRPDHQARFGIRVATATERARGRADRADLRRNASNTWVYGRHRHGCRHCGGPIRTSEMHTSGPATERTVYWCPSCQHD